MPNICEIPFNNTSDDEIKQILSTAKIIAVVGLSAKPEQYSYKVADYLKKQGYRIIPVNPTIAETLSEKAYPNLQDIPEKVDIVDIFRKPEAISEIVDSAIQIGVKVVWMQEGIVNNAAADKARNAGLKVVMDKCIMKQHKSIFGDKEAKLS